MFRSFFVANACFFCVAFYVHFFALAGCLRGSNQGVGAKTTERNALLSVISLLLFFPTRLFLRSSLFLAVHQQVLEAEYSAFEGKKFQ